SVRKRQLAIKRMGKSIERSDLKINSESSPYDVSIYLGSQVRLPRSFLKENKYLCRKSESI
ncbi:hypothetical protein RZN22_10165, partial [Bacillaceae bacterium S4-13-58]